MKANKKKVELAMARACMTSAELAIAAELPRPTLNNVMAGRGVMPATLGKVARALGVDPEYILDTEA